MKEDKLGIYLPEDLKYQLKERALKERTSIKDVCIKALTHYLNKEGAK